MSPSNQLSNITKRERKRFFSKKKTQNKQTKSDKINYFFLFFYQNPFIFALTCKFYTTSLIIIFLHHPVSVSLSLLISVSVSLSSVSFFFVFFVDLFFFFGFVLLCFVFTLPFVVYCCCCPSVINVIIDIYIYIYLS